MFAVHYFENKNKVLSQCLQRVPEVNENLKIKGRRGKVVEVIQIEEQKYHVYVELEKKNNKKQLLNDDKKRRRR